MDEKQQLFEIGRSIEGPLGQIYRLLYRPHLGGLESAAKQIEKKVRGNPSLQNMSTARAALHGLRLAGASFLGYGLEAAIAAAQQPTNLYDDLVFDQTCGIVIPDFAAITEELIEYFARHPEELQKLDWRKFELLLDAVFRNQGFQTELGPGRGDRGVDLRLVQKDSVGELVTLVQAKRYSKQNPIQLEAVAALYAMVEDQQANRGLFVTTSRYLPVAMQFAAKRSKRLVLATSEDVAKWCRAVSRLQKRDRD
jgi:hypothetical protein